MQLSYMAAEVVLGDRKLGALRGAFPYLPDEPGSPTQTLPHQLFHRRDNPEHH